MSAGCYLSLLNGIVPDSTILKNDRKKGKSLIQFPKDYTVIDIETTGLTTMYDEIIELSAMKIRNNVIVDKFTSLVKPKENIDSFITELTGITNDMLKNAPTIQKILPDYIDFIGNDILLGYNINFDINFIYDDYKEYFNKLFQNDFVDLLRIAKKCLQNIENYKLKTVANYYKIDTNENHRGLKDCQITYELYISIVNELLQKYTDAKDFYKQNWYSNDYYAKTLTTTKTVFDETNLFFNKLVVFTGTLEKMQRKEAMQIVLDLGGKISDNLNKETNFLIVGTQDFKKAKENGKSNKMLKAEKYIIKGADLQILSEDAFYDVIANSIKIEDNRSDE